MYKYQKKITDTIEIVSMRPEFAEALEELQHICFPTLAQEELMDAQHYQHHLTFFPEGQFVALDNGKVIGATSTIRFNVDFNHVQHTFQEMFTGGWFDRHQPNGEWLYGMDISVHPDYRKLGLGKALYNARNHYVKTMNLNGQVTVGMMSGYGAIKNELSAEQYFEELMAGKRTDPTLTPQMRSGFVPKTLIPNYLTDPVCDNYGVFIVWDNEEKIQKNMKHIQLKTPIPGPKSLEMLARRAAALPAGLAKSTDVVVESAEGAYIFDIDGNRLLDFAGGIGMMNIGHSNKNIAEAVKKQIDAYTHTCTLVTTITPYVQLAEMLNAITPGDFPKKTLLATSGSEAVENAVNIAKYYTKRPAIVCFEGGYHGRTMLTLSLTSKYGLFKKGFGSMASDIYRLPVPNLYRTPKGMKPNDFLDYCIQNLENALIAQVDPSAIAAILIEPVQGEAGFIQMPTPFLQKIREICDKYGIVMIADEIQSGFGRTGKMFACEHSGVVPDMMTMAKSLGAGYPISAVTGRAAMMDSPHPGGIGGTYGGNPIGCVAAIEVLKEMIRPAFLKHAQALGKAMNARLQTWKSKYKIVGDARGVGPMMVVEFVKDKKTKEPDMDITLTIIRETIGKGLVMIRAGLYSNCIRLLPPLVMTIEQLHEGLDMLEESIKNADKK
jgi:4-aminobutyrate aminotransferase / (S)-3-amino-2-methylpropionate transaminase / 5-aminovalerate transaminase